ncbi:hypothetical protein AB0C84_43515 [Actinomadura sp. NPDC048955]|uniref:hypothetical protein n=1 Tax=Actinomadura sp. NPDC048955 TaxID=3158228 RepID=UPI0033FAB680
MFSRNDFLDALDLDAFADLFRPLGYVKFPGGEDVYQRVGGGRETALRLPRHHDEDGRWRQDVLLAARTYVNQTGWMLFWIPQTEDEAHYASLILGLLLDIRTTESDGWNGGDLVDKLEKFFTKLSLDFETEVPGLDGDGNTPDPAAFLRATLARQHRDLF